MGVQTNRFRFSRGAAPLSLSRRSVKLADAKTSMVFDDAKGGLTSIATPPTCQE